MQTNFFETLKNIPAEKYAPVPFWSWNNKIEPDEARRQIREMKRIGYGGFIIHARAGMTTEYLSEDWFACVQACIDEAKIQKMCVWLYDEFGYPSGFVGGKLLQKEEYLAEYLEYKVLDRFDEKAFAVYVTENDEFRRVLQPTGATEYHTIYKFRSPSNVDILYPEVVSEFIRLTHEEYYARFQDEFGKTIRGFFTDEPQYYRWGTPYSSMLEGEFEKCYGEDVRDGLIHIFKDTEKDYPFRVKYYQTMNRLYTQNYYKRIYNWCEDHHCQLIGHTVEETLLFGQMWCSAGAMPSYQYSHVAGIDHLGYDMSGVMDEVQVESVAMQFNIEQVMSETFACTGYGTDLRRLKYLGDYQYALGINYMVVHLMNYSLQGPGYKDHPQTFSPHCAWWEEYAPFLDYYTKLGYIFANTKRDVHLLWIHPIQDCYLTYDRITDAESVKELEENFYYRSLQLAEKGVAFHYADETMLRDNGKAEGGELVLGDMHYDYVLLDDRKSINASTQDVLEEYVAQGGKLCVVGEYPAFVEGVKGSKALPSTASYDEVLQASAPVAECVGKVFQRHCKGELGEFLFLLNTEKTDVECRLPKGWQVVDFEKETLLDFGEKITLRGLQSVLLKKETEGAGTRSTQKTMCENVTEQFRVASLTDNGLIVDFAQVSTDGKTYGERKYVAQILDEQIRAKHQGDLYVKYVFRAEYLPEDLYLLAQNSRVKAVFVNGEPVELEKTAYDVNFRTAKIATLCRKGENEVVFHIDFYENPNVFYAMYGENVTESLMNMIYYDTLIEPIFVRGSFALNAEYAIVVPALPEKTDNLQTQGYPFFDGTVTLQGEFTVAEACQKTLRLSGAYAAAEVYVNGVHQGAIALTDEREIALKSGTNTVQVLLKSTMRNAYGPHHMKGMQEWWGISPYCFNFPKQWLDGEPKDFTHEYNVAPFGVEKIEFWS